MIRYTLKCRNEHSFEGWFRSGDDFEGLQSRGMVACPECAGTDVEKSLMTPGVRANRKGEKAPSAGQPVTNTPSPDMVEAIRRIRDHVEKNSDYVGDRFAREARAMHLGDIPHRSIYGEVAVEEARQLKEDGVPAMPLPFVPKQKTN